MTTEGFRQFLMAYANKQNFVPLIQNTIDRKFYTVKLVYELCIFSYHTSSCQAHLWINFLWQENHLYEEKKHLNFFFPSNHVPGPCVLCISVLILEERSDFGMTTKCEINLSRGSDGKAVVSKQTHFALFVIRHRLSGSTMYSA